MKKFLEVYCKVDDLLAQIIKHFCAILLATMIVVCFVNTVGRYAFHHSFRAAEEIVILCAVWVTCVGASLTARADDHVSFLACLFLVLLLPAAFEMVKIYSPMKLTGTKWPQWVLYDSYVVGSIAMVLGYLRITPGKVIALWNGTEEKSEYEKINEHEKELEEGKVDE